MVDLEEEALADLAERLRSLRIDAGLSPLELARRASLDPRTIYLAERGERLPRATTRRALTQALDVPVGDLVFYGAR